jgi:hypothetical protein
MLTPSPSHIHIAISNPNKVINVHKEFFTALSHGTANRARTALMMEIRPAPCLGIGSYHLYGTIWNPRT